MTRDVRMRHVVRSVWSELHIDAYPRAVCVHQVPLFEVNTQPAVTSDQADSSVLTVVTTPTMILITPRFTDSRINLCHKIIDTLHNCMGFFVKYSLSMPPVYRF